MCGKVTLDLSVNHLSMSHDFVVVEHLTLNSLIGCDFMYKFNVVINFVNRTVSFMGGLACEQLRNQSNELNETVRTTNFVTLKSYTETIVQERWPKAYRSEVPVVLKPMTRANKQQIWTTRAVVVPTGKNHYL